ncbi:MAG TPA: chromate transporter [Ktedonobacterales bacterium]
MNDEAPHPSAWRLLTIWTGIGLQSFGGGASTTLLIQRTFIDRYRWLSAEEFAQLWNLCLITPGINLIAITLLLGKRFGGWRGMIASLAGLLIPSASITCLLAALYTLVEHSATVEAVVRGIVPATGGVMALVALNFARPLFQRGVSGGKARTALTGALALASALAVIIFNVSAIVIVIASALLGGLLFAPKPDAAPADDGAHQEGEAE